MNGTVQRIHVLVIVAVLSAPAILYAAVIPLGFEADVESSVSCDVAQEYFTDTGVNQINMSLSGSHHGLEYSTRNSLNCSSTPDVATLDVSVSASMWWDPMTGGEGPIEYSCGGHVSITGGGLRVDSTSYCPEGTPLTLSVTGETNNLFNYSNYCRLLRGDDVLYDASEPPTGSLEIPVYAGELLSIELLAYYSSNYSAEGTISFSCEGVPEPATALLLLAGLPMIRRR